MLPTEKCPFYTETLEDAGGVVADMEECDPQLCKKCKFDGESGEFFCVDEFATGTKPIEDNRY